MGRKDLTYLGNVEYGSANAGMLTHPAAVAELFECTRSLAEVEASKGGSTGRKALAECPLTVPQERRDCGADWSSTWKRC